MQADRLFGIVYLLLSRGAVTAGELSDRFEVSRRTIYRDIETLSAAGVPVYAVKGKGGGIRLMESFTLNSSLLSEQEQREVLSALAGLRVTGAARTDAVFSKLSAVFHRDVTNWISVDFSDWGREDGERFDILKTATLERKVVRFRYYASSGESMTREAEPLQLCFKHRAWYLRAWCRARRAERLFKLSRIRDLEPLDIAFQPEAATERAEASPPSPPFIVQVMLRVDLSQAHRVYDEFDAECVRRLDDHFLIETDYPMDDWVIGYLLSFGQHLEVIGPGGLRAEVARRLREALKKYESG